MSLEFQEEVLDRAPVLFWRCHEPSSTSTVEDFSGNGFDGDRISPNIIQGQTGQVETDADSRSIHVPGGFADQACEIDEPPAGLLFTGDFTIACFGRHEQSAGYQYLLGRGGIAGGGADGLHFLTNGNTTRTLQCWILTTDGVTTTSSTVVAGTSHLNDTLYFFVVTRVGPVLSLYVNAVLVGQNTGASADPLEVDGSDRLVFGAGANNLGPFKGNLSELIVCDYGWTLSDIQEVYRASKLTTAVSGVARGTSTASLNSFVAPEPELLVFRHNGKAEVIERLTKLTAISRARAGREQRGGARARHRREIEYLTDTEDESMRRRLDRFLFRNQRRVVAVPVQVDQTRLAFDLDAGATVVPVETAGMDYDAGGRVALYNFSTGKGETAVIEEVEASQLTLRTGTRYAWPRQTTTVAPAVRALLEERINLAAANDRLAEARLVARVLVEDVPASPNRFAAWEPTYTYRTLEVFDPFLWGRHDYAEPQQAASEQGRDAYDYGVGVFGAESGEDAAAGSFTHRLHLKGRARISAFLGWWEARSGARVPLWVPTMREDFKVVGIAGDEVTVNDSGYLEAYDLHDARRDVAFVLKDRTLELRRIDAAEEDGANEVLTVDSGAPALSTVRRVCLLKPCRLDADAVELAWLKWDELRVTVRFRELLTSV